MTRILADKAWIDGAWASDVLLVAAADGRWSEVSVGCTAKQAAGAVRLPGAALPGLVDAHSHAFQRAIAGLTERLPPGQSDSFWTWRDRMYEVALAVSAQELEDIAAHLYGELLQGGYTHVCEFHYLHGTEPLEMAMALVRAARRAGIGLTLLPTLYMRSGFGARGLREDQRRFASTPDTVLRIAEAVRAEGDASVTAGIALHSLRAVEEGALREAAQAARAAGLPVHLHIAEQQLEVDDCRARHGRRPIEWLLENARLDAHWNLVHATQATTAELQGVHETGAAIVICPTTEANLGDGVFELPTWLQLGGNWSIGSDSHVGRGWVEELRWLEYSQRLVRHERNVAARAAGRESTAAVLFDGAVAGGAAASGLPLGGLQVGARADLCVLPEVPEPWRGATAETRLDRLVFSGPGAEPRAFLVAGTQVADGAP
ncbi:MAG TPA: formimidoylglutamate deiminase [Ramlibacter sp.]|nr:formimidoylglutamate deiminase [Ramlibacter sp.]